MWHLDNKQHCAYISIILLVCIFYWFFAIKLLFDVICAPHNGFFKAFKSFHFNQGQSVYVCALTQWSSPHAWRPSPQTPSHCALPPLLWRSHLACPVAASSTWPEKDRKRESKGLDTERWHRQISGPHWTRPNSVLSDRKWTCDLSAGPSPVPLSWRHAGGLMGQIPWERRTEYSHRLSVMLAHKNTHVAMTARAPTVCNSLIQQMKCNCRVEEMTKFLIVK